MLSLRIRRSWRPAFSAGVAALLSCAGLAQADLIVDQNLGTVSATQDFLLEGSYAGRTSNALTYTGPAYGFPFDNRDLGEYVYQFNTTVRGRVRILLFSPLDVPRFQVAMVLNTRAVDSNGVNSGLEYARNRSFNPAPATINPGTYYVAFDDSSFMDPSDPVTPAREFRAILDFEKLQLSATVTGETSSQNIWALPAGPSGHASDEDQGYTAAYATPIPFFVSEAGTYSLQTIAAGFEVATFFYRDAAFPEAYTTSEINLIGFQYANLVPNQQYYLVVSTLRNTFQSGFGPTYPLDTPGPFSLQFEGPGVATVGLVPAPAAWLPLGMGLVVARRRRR